jgi:hypothetical protein
LPGQLEVTLIDIDAYCQAVLADTMSQEASHLTGTATDVQAAHAAC